MKSRIIFIIMILALTASCGPARTMAAPAASATMEPGTLYVDPDQDLGPISPYVYGANYSLGISTGKPENVLDSKITAMRFPGGSWGDHNDLMIFQYQIDQFMNLCKQMGAMPTVSVRLLDGTPQAAADLVRYFNIEKKYGIVYWSIGNEPNLYDSLPKVDYDTVRFNQEWRSIALAMKAVDPSIKLMGPELSQWGTEIAKTPKYPATQTPTGLERQDWMTDFLKANGDLVDIVTVHRYPIYAPNSKTPITVDSLRLNTLEWEPMVTYLRGMVQQITGRDLPVAFTEVNSDPSDVLGGVASPDSFYNAIWYADVLGHLIQQNVFMVNYWVLAGSGGLGLLTANNIRPTYYVFQMYSHFGNEQVYASSGLGFVSIYASQRADGSLTLMVINLTDYEQRVSLQVRGVRASKAETWLFDAKHNAEDLGLLPFPSDGTLILPEQSITLYAISK